MVFTIFFGAQSSFCSNNKSQIVVVEKIGVKHSCPPLYCSDIYTNGKADDGREKLLANMQKLFPVLTISEIEACIRYCNSFKRDADLISECQEFEMWKVAHKEELSKKKCMNDSYFPDYLIGRD